MHLNSQFNSTCLYGIRCDIYLTNMNVVDLRMEKRIIIKLLIQNDGE